MFNAALAPLTQRHCSKSGASRTTRLPATKEKNRGPARHHGGQGASAGLPRCPAHATPAPRWLVAVVIWHQLLVGLTAAGYGLLSAVVPLVNAEAYVLAARASGWGTASVVGITVGQAVGKLVLFLAARRGRQLPVYHWRRSPRVEGPVSPPGRFRRLTARLLVLLGTKRWGLPVVLLAAVVSIPPLYAVAILAGTTSMKTGWFLATVTVGRLARFALLVVGMAEVVLYLH